MNDPIAALMHQNQVDDAMNLDGEISKKTIIIGG